MPMDIRITFHNMDHSAPLEGHAKTKLEKITHVLKLNEKMHPFFVELRLTAHKLHLHHSADLQLKTPLFNLNTHEEGTDLYVALDDCIDKMVKLVNKEREKSQDKRQKSGNEKTEFIDVEDKYTLKD